MLLNIKYFCRVTIQQPMKKTTLTIVIAVSSFGVNAQQNQSYTAEKKWVNWETQTSDAGKIPQSVPDTIVFEFTNVSNTPLIITAVKTPCQCTSAGHTEEVIKPGKKGHVTAIYNAANPGTFSKTITVTFNVPEANSLLVLKGEVVKRMTED